MNFNDTIKVKVNGAVNETVQISFVHYKSLKQRIIKCVIYETKLVDVILMDDGNQVITNCVY